MTMNAAGGCERWFARPAVVAMLTWALTLPLAAGLPAWLDVDPFDQREADLPLAVGGVAVAIVAGLALRRRHAWVAGAAAGLFAAFTVLVMRTSLHGTPFAFEGLDGDTGRLQAVVTRYTVAWTSSDGIVADAASEYPPLFPFLIGKAAVLLDRPAWQLLAPAEIVTLSGSVIASFLLWSRLVAAPAALAISALGLLVFPSPAKAFEVFALAVVIPWVLLAIGRPERGRLHWLPAGLLGGVLVLLYYAYLIYAAPAIIWLAWSACRAAPSRRDYALHLVRAAGVALVMSAWFLIPYAAAAVGGLQQVADMWDTPMTSENPFPFLELTPLGLVQLAGVAGLLRFRRTEWWATPLLAIVLGAYGYRALSMLRWVFSGHTGLLYYTTPLISACLTAAAVLTAVRAGPALARRLGGPVPSGTGVAVLAVLLAFAGHTAWAGWMPGTHWVPTAEGPAELDLAPGGWTNQLAARAHGQRFADGTRPRFAGRTRGLGESEMVPVDKVREAVERVRGPGARPRTLSYDDKLYAYLPWRGYIGAARTASNGVVRWDDRYRELTKLTRTADPAAFARESASTPFGPIEVFVLRRAGPHLVFRALQVPTSLYFTRQQFDPARFVIVGDLPNRTFVAIRR